MQHPLHKIPQPLRSQQALAFLRVAIGSFYLYVGWQKVNAPQFAVGLASQLQNWAAQNPFFWYQDFLRYLAIPNAPSLAFLVGWGEVLVGASLILGLLVPVTAPAAFLMNLNYFLAGQHSSPAVMAVNLAFMIIALTLFWADAGKFFGLDYWILRERGTTGPKNKTQKRKIQTRKPPSASGKKKNKTASKLQATLKAKPLKAVKVSPRIENLIDDEDDEDED